MRVQAKPSAASLRISTMRTYLRFVEKETSYMRFSVQ
nr:MAG TPA: hypothetical protein [Caudoviricetes sp.]